MKEIKWKTITVGLGKLFNNFLKVLNNFINYILIFCSYCSHHQKICLGEVCKPNIPTTIAPRIVSTTSLPSVCLPGEVWDDCIVRCDHICHSYLLEAVSLYNCSSKDNCVKGCRKTDLICSKGKFLRDENTCVDKKDCPCMTKSGLFIKVCKVFCFFNRSVG